MGIRVSYKDALKHGAQINQPSTDNPSVVAYQYLGTVHRLMTIVNIGKADATANVTLDTPDPGGYWQDHPFTGTRELGGLRVMMALINNWDLTDDNTSVYRETPGKASDAPRFVYMASDLGCSFGTTAQGWKRWKTKGNLKSYRHSKFVRRMTPENVDFSIPALPSLDYLFNLRQFAIDVRLHWIGRHILRADARWIGQLLARLSPGQIRDAFRAAGYSEAEVQAFTQVVEERIRVLTEM